MGSSLSSCTHLRSLWIKDSVGPATLTLFSALSIAHLHELAFNLSRRRMSTICDPDLISEDFNVALSDVHKRCHVESVRFILPARATDEDILSFSERFKSQTFSKVVHCQCVHFLDFTWIVRPDSLDSSECGSGWEDDEDDFDDDEVDYEEIEHDYDWESEGDDYNDGDDRNEEDNDEDNESDGSGW